MIDVKEVGMNSFWWIGTILLSSVGGIFLIVEIFGWVYRKVTRPRTPENSYYILPVAGGDDLEEQLRYAMNRLRWETESVMCVLLVDQGIDQPSMEICKSFCRQNEGALLCTTEELGKIVRFCGQDKRELDPNVKIYGG